MTYHKHYARNGQDRWALLDFAVERDYDLYQFVMLRYLDRWKAKDGVDDLRKLADYLEKYIKDNSPKGAENNAVGDATDAEVDAAMNVGIEGARTMTGNVSQSSIEAALARHREF